MSYCNASVFEISSLASFSGVLKLLWEARLRLEDIDLSEVLAVPEGNSLLLTGMRWSKNTPMQRQEATCVGRRGPCLKASQFVPRPDLQF